MNLTIEQIAEVTHEVNRAYCNAIGDNTQLAWADAPEWQRSSAVKGVEFLVEYPSATPKTMHQNWMAIKLAEGWRFGAEKSAEQKTHPCLLPFDDLPQAQKAKDYLFSGVVLALKKIGRHDLAET